MVDFSISIDSLKGILKTVAENIDKNRGNNDGFISGNEVSIFRHEATNLKTQGRISASEYNSVFRVPNPEISELNQQIIEPNDATYVAPKYHVDEIKQPQVQTVAASADESYKNHPKYEQTLELVKKQLDKKNPMDKAKGGTKYNQHAEYVTKIVIEKCQKYNIEDLIPVIAEMLGVESGGYVFNDKVMVHKGSKYKGVMQCDLTTCQIIYGEGKGEYDHKRYLSQDDQRINELKSKYPTANDLYKAMQHDVELGLEVGILALKAKIASRKGSVAGGIAGYCGNQYRCNIPGVPTTIDISKTV